MNRTLFLRPDTPCEIEGKNFRRSYRELQSGPQYRVTFEVSKDLWDACELIPRDSIVRGVLYHTSGDEQTLATEESDEPAAPLPLPPPEKPTRGIWGAFYRELWARGFQNNPELIAELKVNGMGDSVAVALRSRFKEDSRTKISPDRLTSWLAAKRLQGALKIADDAIKRLGGTEYKWGKKESAA